MSLPKFFAVNDRPAKVVDRPDGGVDVMVLDMRTGEWERDFSYLTKFLTHSTDVDQLTEEEFTAAVKAVRDRLEG
jgi:hypothetical protein